MNIINRYNNKTEDPSVLAAGIGYKHGNTQTDSLDKKGKKGL